MLPIQQVYTLIILINSFFFIYIMYFKEYDNYPKKQLIII